MALNIKDAETDEVAREVAALTGESITVAVRTALRERLTRLRARDRAQGADLSDIIRRGRRRATLDDRDMDEILGYGDDGLPS